MDNIKNMIDLLKGKRTYLLVVAAFAVIAGYLFGWIDQTTADVILPILGFGSVASLRAGIK
jgi:hypothetical protein